MGKTAQELHTGNAMNIVERAVAHLIPYARNPRKNDASVDSVAASIKEFGFKQPIVVDAQGVVVVGHTRLKAAQKLGLETVPVVVAEDLTPEQIKAYRILDNKVGEKSEWDAELLQLELSEIQLDLKVFEVDFPFTPDIAAEDWKEFDESAAEDVPMTECPECGHRFPK